jgi:phage-related protein (TIGR01555 family)
MATVHPLPAAAPRRPLVARLADGYQNLMSRLGTAWGDRNANGSYGVPLLTQQQIENAYRTSWLTRKVHDLPAFEMTRAGRDWKADNKQIELLENAERDLRVWPKLFQALVTARLHGGSALILGVLGAGSPEQELFPDRVRKGALRYLYVASRHQLSAPQGFETDAESPYFGGPRMWQMRGARGNSVDIHPSRVITFHGSTLPPGIITVAQLDQFWGDPLFYALKSAVDNAEVSQAAVATLLHEMKQDVISIPGLTQQIATADAEETIAARVEALARFKSMFNVLMLDRGDGTNEASGEKWETRQISFAQHPELLREFVGIVGGAADIPVTRLMGTSPGGLQSTGKGEQQDFNRMIMAKQTFELAPPLARLDAVLIPSVLGSRPPEIYSEFAPLEEPGPREAAEIEKMEAETVDILTRTSHIPRDAMAKAVFNRMNESGRWPGLEQAVDESALELGEQEEPEEPAPTAANENDVQEMERRGTITRDQALTLLADAAPRSLYVSRKLLNAREFIAWAKSQGFETTVPPEELHATVMYSRAPVDWMKAGGDGWGGDEKGELHVTPGGPRLVERFDGGAIVLAFANSALSWRHEDIKRAGASPSRDEYQPHVTITYQAPEGFDLSKVEPYQGALHFGPEIFQEISEDWGKGLTER